MLLSAPTRSKLSFCRMLLPLAFEPLPRWFSLVVAAGLLPLALLARLLCSYLLLSFSSLLSSSCRLPLALLVLAANLLPCPSCPLFSDALPLLSAGVGGYCITLRCVALHCIALRCGVLHCVALHCTTLRNIIILQYNTCMHAYIDIYIHAHRQLVKELTLQRMGVFS